MAEYDEINQINELLNSLIQYIQEQDSKQLFTAIQFIWDTIDDSYMDRKGIVRSIANVMRFFTIKGGYPISFIEEIVTKLDSEYVFLLEYTSFQITRVALGLLAGASDVSSTVQSLLDIKNNPEEDYIDRLHALIYLGNILLDTKKPDENEAYFAALEDLKREAQGDGALFG